MVKKKLDSSVIEDAMGREVEFEDFELKKVIGRGTFGKVFLATLKGTDMRFAIKSIRKDVLLEYDQVDGVLLEK